MTVGKTETLDLLIESRQTVNDLRDRKVIAEAQLSGHISADLSYGHTGPLQEPWPTFWPDFTHPTGVGAASLHRRVRA